MDVPGTASLKQARLHLSTEAEDHVYLLEEPGTGQLLRLSAKIAARILSAKQMLLGQRTGDAAQRKSIAALAQHLNTLRRRSLQQKKPFNPLFINVPLFDVRPFQPMLQTTARIFFSRGMAAALIALTLLAIWVTASTNFAFFDRIGDIFSIEVLLTFALIAPLLKIFHELGHVLAATRFGVPVRRAGVILIALFPMPFVDCTEAEFRAQRRERIIISLAGLFSDLTIGLIAFLLWHVAEAEPLRQLLANIFIFSTLTTLIFNLNPLMRLDGYFALSDALHRRNLHTDSAAALKRVTDSLISLRPALAVDAIRRRSGRVLFAAASVGYKVYIVAVIAWALLPQYLGIGALIVAWGAAVMFLTPIMRPAPPNRTTSEGWRRMLGRVLLLGVLVLIAFIPMPYSHVSALKLDVDGTYAVRSAVDGRVVELGAVGQVNSGEPLIRLENIETDVRLALNKADQNMFSYLSESMAASDPLAAQAGQERLSAASALEADLRRQAADLQLKATTNGQFFRDNDLRQGGHVALGDRIGILLPATDGSIAHAALPEIYAEKFTTALTGAEVMLSTGYLSQTDGVAVRLSEAEAASDATARSFRLIVEVPAAPSDLVVEPMRLRLTFADEPLWRHAVFLWRRLRLNLQQTEQLSREQAFE